MSSQFESDQDCGPKPRRSTLVPQPNGTMESVAAVQIVEEVRMKRIKQQLFLDRDSSPRPDPQGPTLGPEPESDTEPRDLRPKPAPSRTCSLESQNEGVGGQIFYTPFSSPSSRISHQLHHVPSNGNARERLSVTSVGKEDEDPDYNPQLSECPEPVPLDGDLDLISVEPPKLPELDFQTENDEPWETSDLLASVMAVYVGAITNRGAEIISINPPISLVHLQGAFAND
ncbi:hypothetical protein K491DRAFT_682974 [Lophiostoma macrostomum CBS 122681]|uniref:Uncharacterized protein n=1 Tax=Lophiostoma macrostomum CBS 122681 TaxID=1314788 RepID=A0A6A6SRW1_9PLEO|nr:hypothetical protein K491DRAFT_682974 [Lophiostoma macrostomum CBS 122681]